MADEQDDPSGLIDMARSVYKGANDLINKIPTPGYNPQPSAHDAAIKKMNKDADDKRVQDANKTYVHSTQTPAQKKAAPAPTTVKTVTKISPRKR